MRQNNEKCNSKMTISYYHIIIKREFSIEIFIFLLIPPSLIPSRLMYVSFEYISIIFSNYDRTVYIYVKLIIHNRI